MDKNEIIKELCISGEEVIKMIRSKKVELTDDDLDIIERFVVATIHGYDAIK